MGISVQIFGTRNSQATRAAERFFKERRIQIHFVDLQVKPMSPGEIKRFIDKFGLAGLVDPAAKEYEAAGLKYLRVADADLLAKIEKAPKLMKLPLVRCGNRISIGYDESGWKSMLD